MNDSNRVQAPAAASLKLNFHVQQEGRALWFDLTNEASRNSLFCGTGRLAGAYLMVAGQTLNVQTVANSNGSSAEYVVQMLSAEVQAQLLRGTPPAAFPFVNSQVQNPEYSVTPLQFSGSNFLTSNEDGTVQFLSALPLQTTTGGVGECANEISVVMRVSIGGRECTFTLDPEVIVEQPR